MTDEEDMRLAGRVGPPSRQQNQKHIREIVDVSYLVRRKVLPEPVWCVAYIAERAECLGQPGYGDFVWKIVGAFTGAGAHESVRRIVPVDSEYERVRIAYALLVGTSIHEWDGSALRLLRTA